MENKDEKEIDVTNKTSEEIIDIYAKVSENILMLNTLLDREENKEEAIKKYQKVKNKL